MMSGSDLKVGFIQENGARFVTNVLNPGQGAIFPKGSFHYQVNLDCQPVNFVAGLNSVDPGATTIGQRCKCSRTQFIHRSIDPLPLAVFGIPPEVVDATLGDIGVSEVVQIAKSVSTGLHYRV